MLISKIEDNNNIYIVYILSEYKRERNKIILSIKEWFIKYNSIMAFFQLILHANHLEKVRKAYEDEKLTSIDIWKSGEHRFTIKQRIRRRKLWLDLIR